MRNKLQVFYGPGAAAIVWCLRRESLNAGIVTEWTYNVAGNEMNANRAACIEKSNAPGVGVGAGVGKKEIIAF